MANHQSFDCGVDAQTIKHIDILVSEFPTQSFLERLAGLSHSAKKMEFQCFK